MYLYDICMHTYIHTYTYTYTYILPIYVCTYMCVHLYILIEFSDQLDVILERSKIEKLALTWVATTQSDAVK